MLDTFQRAAGFIPAVPRASRIAHTMPTILLAYYCALILVASIIGGMIPVWFQLTHRWMQFAVSFVAGGMLGIGVLHMLPHALLEATAAAESSPEFAATPSAASGLAVHWITISLLA